MDIIESMIYRRAYGLASDLAEARSHRPAGRLYDAPGAGGMPPRSSRRSAAGWPSGRSMTTWWPRPSRMRGRVEGRGGDARADRRTGADPDECADGSPRLLTRAHRAVGRCQARSGPPSPSRGGPRSPSQGRPRRGPRPPRPRRLGHAGCGRGRCGCHGPRGLSAGRTPAVAARPAARPSRSRRTKKQR
jgi:hypothetical protein